MFLNVDNVGAKRMSSGGLFQGTVPATQNAKCKPTGLLSTNKYRRFLCFMKHGVPVPAAILCEHCRAWQPPCWRYTTLRRRSYNDGNRFWAAQLLVPAAGQATLFERQKNE